MYNHLHALAGFGATASVPFAVRGLIATDVAASASAVLTIGAACVIALLASRCSRLARDT
jgi:hypothetical protein